MHKPHQCVSKLGCTPPPPTRSVFPKLKTEEPTSSEGWMVGPGYQAMKRTTVNTDHFGRSQGRNLLFRSAYTSSRSRSSRCMRTMALSPLRSPRRLRGCRDQGHGIRESRRAVYAIRGATSTDHPTPHPPPREMLIYW